MKVLLLLLVLALSLALVAGKAGATGMYKCVRDGRSTYQDTPCNAASKQTVLQAVGSSAWIGCYVATFPGESTSSTERFEIRAAANAEFEIVFKGSRAKQSLPMKRASTGELAELSKGFHARFTDGLGMKWPPGTPNQKPIGIYNLRTGDGKPMTVAYFFVANGAAEKVDCK